MIGFYQSLHAQTDDCASAEVITPGSATCSYQSGTSAGASQSLATCSGGGNADDDVWYQFVANSTEMHIKVNPSDLYDPVVQLFSGTCGGLTSISCMDLGADGVTEEIIASGLTNGNTYFVRVYDYGTGSGSNDFSICVFGVPSPTNDDPCSATALPEVTPSCNMGTYTTVGATDSGEPAPGTCGTVGYSGGDIWFTAVVPANGAIEISSQVGSMADGVLAIYTGTCGALTLVTCDDDSGPGTMPYLYQTGLTPGATVWIRFWEFNNDNPGTFDMCVSSPLNDDCADATLICDFNGYGGITSAQYTVDLPDNMEGNLNGGPFGTGHTAVDVTIENNSWITFVANGPTAVLDIEVEYCENGNGMQMQVFSGTNCTNFAAVSNFLQTTSSQQLTATGLTVGETYYIMIDGFAGDVCNYTITAQSGVQVVDITSSSGTILCNGQTSELTVEADGATGYSWSANPGGPFGTGLQTETVVVTTTTVYTVTVTGFCDVAETANITISPSKTVTADFTGEDIVSSAPYSFPATMSCEDDDMLLIAEDSADVSGYITPAMEFIFTSDNFTEIDNGNVTIYEDGTPIYATTLTDNTILTVYGEYLSPTSNYTFDLCETFGDGGVDWEVFDLNTGLSLGSGSMVSGNPCENFGPFSPVGLSTWTIVPVSATPALATSDFGYAIFQPDVAGVGSYDITYCWDNTVGCSDCETKTVDVTNPHDASWNPPVLLCENDGLLDLITLIDVSASSTTGTWTGTGVSGTDFDPTGLSGPISVTYTVAGTNCQDAVAHDITVTDAPSLTNLTHQRCEDAFGTGTASGIDLTSMENIIDGGAGLTFSWYIDVGLTSSVGTPNNVTATNGQIYYASVTDGSCASIGNVTMSIESMPSITVSSTSVTCNGDADGTVSVVASGGPTTNYTYTWNPPAGNTDPAITGLSPNTYNVTVHSLVCHPAGSVTVAEPSNVTATITGSISVTCNGASTGTASASGSGGNGVPYSFNWSTAPVQNTSTATGLAAGTTYSVTVTDQFGSCFDVTTITLAEPATSVTASIIGNTSITCNGGSNGTATASGAGGNGAPYTYNWNTTPGQTSQTATGLSPGTTYFVTVTDGSGVCQDITSVTIAEPSAVTVSFAATSDASCITGTDGQSTASGTGGAGGYTFLWDGGTGNQTTATATGLTPGTYSVTVSDVLLCPGVGTITIGNTNTLPVATITNPSQLNCLNTTITLDASGSTGTGALTYNWSTGGGNIVSGGTTDSPGIDLPGTYTVTITDGASGCTDSETTTVTQNVTVPTTTITACNNTTSVGGTDGSISVAVGTAPGPYTYGWSPVPAAGQTDATATGLSASSYNVTVTASNGCSVSDGCTVNDPGCLVTVSITTVTDVSCNGGTDGQATVQMTGGTGTSWTYSWVNTQTGQTVTGLSQGSYGVTVTDNNGCIGSTSANINQPAVLGVSSSVNQHVSCNGQSDGSATVTVIGGTTPYNYNWPGGLSNSTETALFAGTYAVTVTDVNTCNDVTSFTVTEPQVLAAVPTCNNTSVAGGTDGSSSVVVTGGDSNYSYSWSNGSTTNSATGLSAGAVFVTVTDGNLCSVTTTCNVSDPGCAVTISTTVTNVTCNGGSDGQVIASASNGVLPYVFAWSDGQTGATATGLSTGNITVSVTDGALCVDDATISISEPSPVQPNMSCSPTSIAGASDGSSTTAASGGAGGYTYQWSTGATTAGLTGISAGTYTVTVTDASTCAVTASCNVVDAGCALSLSTTTTNVTCFGNSNGQVTTALTGGVSPFVYSWSDGQTTANATGLSGGSISVTIVDGGSCSVTDVLTITEPQDLSVTSSSVTDVSCNGFSDGTAELTIAGGTTPYTFSWDNGTTSSLLTGVPTGTYGYTVSDGNGCAMAAGSTISGCVKITDILVDACVGSTDEGDREMFFFTTGSSTLNASSITVTWNTKPWMGLCPNPTFVTNTNATITGGGMLVEPVGGVIPPNSNVVLMTSDALTVSQMDFSGLSTTLYVLFQCADVDLTGYFGNYSGSGGTRTLAIDFGGGCSDNVSYERDLLVNIFGLPGGSSTDKDGATVSYDDLGNATYTNNGCIAPYTNSTTNEVTINEPTALSVTVTSADILCSGYPEASAQMMASGGSTPYSYQWDNGQTTAVITGMVPGCYSGTVTDINSCSIVTVACVSEPPMLSVTNVSTTNAVCGAGNATASITVTGGLGTTYSYFWDGGETTASISGLPNGQHCVTIADGLNATCTIPFCVTVSVIPGPTLSVTNAFSLACSGDCDGVSSTTVTDNGGSTLFSYIWSDGQTTNASTGLCAGNYSVTVTDGNNCSVTDAVTVSEPPALTLTVNGSSVCDGMSDGTVSAILTGGVTPYSYLWDNGINTSTQSGLGGGTYTVAGTDGNSCVSSGTVTVSIDPLPVTNDVSDTLCETVFGTSTTNAVDLTTYEGLINGGVVTFSWFQNDQVTVVANPNSEDIFNTETFYVVVDDGQCQDSAQVDLSVLQGASVSVTGGGLVCTDSSNSVDVVFSFDGNTPYSFTYVHDQDSTTVTGYNSSSFSISTNVGGAGSYNVINLTGSNGCTNTSISDTVAVTAAGPISDFVPDITDGDPPLEVNFSNFSSDDSGEFYSWDFGDGGESTEFEPSHTYTEGGDYEVVLAVEDILGCTDTSFYQYVIVSNESSFLIPVVFSPNDDGVNDEFYVLGYNLESVEGEIFNRWGERVCQIANVSQGWDGRTFAGSLAPEGTYFVILYITGADGVEHEPYSGNLTLVR